MNTTMEVFSEARGGRHDSIRFCSSPSIELLFHENYLESYEQSALKLKLCYIRREKDRRYVIRLLIRTINHTEKSADSGRVPGFRPVVQPSYPKDFYKYLLEISYKEKFDLPGYCSGHPDTRWKYSRMFSVSGAVADGDYERTLFLLQHGVEVIPEETIGMCPIIIKDELFLKTIRIMTSIKSKNQEMNRLMGTNHDIFKMNANQKRCFELMWRAIPTPYIRISDSFEITHLVIKYCNMYVVNFKEMASRPKQPRSLKHLSRCVIRGRLQDNWNLPQGINDLDLPGNLHRYLNLEE